MRRLIALTVCVTLSGSACAGGYRVRSAPASAPTSDQSVMASYVKQLQIGSRVRIQKTDRRTLRATLMKVDDRAIYVQPRTRIPEPIMTVPLDQIAWVELDPQAETGGPGRAIAIGVAAGAGAAAAFILILAAIFGGD